MLGLDQSKCVVLSPLAEISAGARKHGRRFDRDRESDDRADLGTATVDRDRLGGKLLRGDVRQLHSEQEHVGDPAAQEGILNEIVARRMETRQGRSVTRCRRDLGLDDLAEPVAAMTTREQLHRSRSAPQSQPPSLNATPTTAGRDATGELICWPSPCSDLISFGNHLGSLRGPP